MMPNFCECIYHDYYAKVKEEARFGESIDSSLMGLASTISPMVAITFFCEYMQVELSTWI